jgi:hypothetical protein
LRKEVPMLITVLSGLSVIVGQYLKFAQDLNWLTYLNTWYQVAYTVASAVGFVSLTIVHGHNIVRKRTGWINSLILIVAMYAYVVVCFISGPSQKGAMQWVYNAYISPASATLYAMIAFIITSATFRTFRFRTREAAVLAISALIILLAQAPLGNMIWSGWNTVAYWIIAVPQGAAQKAILLGAYLGAFAVALRVLLGIERAHIGGVAK